MSSRNTCVCTHFYPFTALVFLDAAPFWASLVSLQGLKCNSKLSCHRQLCYKRLALFPIIVFSLLLWKDSHTSICCWNRFWKSHLKKKMTFPQATTGLSWCLCLHSAFEKSTVFCLKFYRVLWKHTTDSHQKTLDMTRIIADLCWLT